MASLVSFFPLSFFFYPDLVFDARVSQDVCADSGVKGRQ